MPPENPPLLSLVVPHRNHLHCLPRLLDSILAQNFKGLEVVLVDDHSDEPCGTLVEAWRRKGLDIVLLEHRERIYTMGARLAGIRAARGEIIGFADADDLLWGTEALGRNVALFLQERPDILHFRSVLIDANGVFRDYAPDPNSDPWALMLEGAEIFKTYSKTYLYASSSLWNKLFSREIGLTVCNIVQKTSVRRYSEDTYLSILFTFHSRKYSGSPHVGYGHHYEEEKKYTEAAERAVNHRNTLQELIPWLKDHGCPEESVAWCAHGLQQLLCVSVGHMSIAVGRQGKTSVSDTVLDHLLDQTDEDTLLETLLLGNSLNTQKILKTYPALFPKPDFGGAR
ncbi:hypothetical protein FACS1894205_1150 [Alphaproteobacteria bacterium]|nr:hypothetical protein FACS1894205_1150 [Alphaproteobacteria bacterium]